MKLISFRDFQRLAVGTVVDGVLINLSKLVDTFEAKVEKTDAPPVHDAADFLARGYWEKKELERLMDFLQGEKEHEKFEVGSDYQTVAPVPRPPKIIALGRNYALHAAESNMPVPSEPIIFAKTSSSVIGPGETIFIPGDVGRIDHEVELAVVIGRTAKGVPASDAFKYVAGYTIALDISARDLQRSDIEKSNPWYRSKNFDTFTPIGPWLVTADEIPAPIELDIELRVNDQVRQKANTREMIFDIPKTIAFITKYITLEPGDIISTGTPEGIGPIRDGDRIVSRIEKIGEMVNNVREL